MIFFLLLFLTFHVRSETTSFPEPMVFDLVRGLDNKRGEVEVNSLLFTPDGTHFTASPEIEFSVKDGLSFELETPMLDEKLKALKYSGQYTFLREESRLFAGLQGIYEKVLNQVREDFSLLAIVDYRFTPTWTAVIMSGARTAFLAHRAHHAVMILNVSFFYQLSDHLYLGVESDKNFYFIEKNAKMSTIPQVSWRVTEVMRVQGGVGTDWQGREMKTFFRVIGEF